MTTDTEPLGTAKAHGGSRRVSVGTAVHAASSCDRPIFVNVRALSAASTGVQRYLSEVLARFPVDAAPIRIAPNGRRQGPQGHLWEQFKLPRIAAGGLLWSPCNSGPVRAGRHVVTLHDIGPLDHPELWSRRYARWYAYMTPRLARSATHVITVSEFTRERVHERLGVPLDRITAIPLAPGIASLDDTPRENEADGHAAEPRYVLALGSLDPRKRVDDIVASWERIHPDFPDTELRIVGGIGASHVFGRHSARDVATLERVRFLGRVSDAELPALYANAAVFVSASSYEGFGLPPLEAMALGAPVVATDIAAHREVLADAAEYVSIGDIDGLASAMAQLLSSDSDRNRLVETGLRRCSLYSWETTADRTRELLEAHV